MTRLRPHIVAAASISRGATSGLVCECACPPPDVLVVVGAVRERPAKTATGMARTSGGAHRRGQLSTFRWKLMIADLPVSTGAGSERVGWFARGEG